MVRIGIRKALGDATDTVFGRGVMGEGKDSMDVLITRIPDRLTDGD
jgi:hypothetical protein